MHGQTLFRNRGDRDARHLAVLVVRYRVEVKDFAGETFEQKKERLLEIKPEIALT